VYIDDVIIFSEDLSQHIEHVEQALKLLGSYGLRIKLSNCFFALTRLNILGHIVDKESIRVDADKVSIIGKYPTPRNTTKARAFLGIASYYRIFIPGFAKVAKPLHELTSPRAVFEWTSTHQSALENLKQSL
jgi:hypothetical protein